MRQQQRFWGSTLSREQNSQRKVSVVKEARLKETRQSLRSRLCANMRSKRQCSMRQQHWMAADHWSKLLMPAESRGEVHCCRCHQTWQASKSLACSAKASTNLSKHGRLWCWKDSLSWRQSERRRSTWDPWPASCGRTMQTSRSSRRCLCNRLIRSC